MAKIYLKPTVQWYKDQIGYSSGSSKSSKYSKELDAVKFYNYPKNGAANWCAIFDDCGIYENAIDASVSEVRAMVYEPNNDNCGAGCAQKIDYFKKAKAWYPHKAKGCPAQIGDQIFFGASQYKSSSNPLGAYHTGVVIDWDSKGLYTAEGNTNGKGDVSKRFYAYSDKKILGFGRPNWTGVEPPEEKKDEKPEPTPAPSAPATPVLTSEKIDSLAKEVISGKYGNYPERKTKLNSLGYGDIYSQVQARVNELLKDDGSTSGAPAQPVETTKYTVSAKGGLWLRKSPPSNKDSVSGDLAGGKIVCMSYGDTFVEQKRDNKWSYGTYNGKSGWTCNAYLTKK